MRAWNDETVKYLKAKALDLRRETVITTFDTRCANPGHTGPALSQVDILTALYYHVMRLEPATPQWPDRDRLVLSKGHACVSLYVALADRGFFPKSELKTFRRLGSILQGHPDMRKTPGIDMTAGSLGHGLGAGVGIALAAKIDKRDYRTFVIVGDGESQEGVVWEAALAAARYKLNNLVMILDYNHFQSGGSTDVIMPIEPVVDKWRSFGWNVLEANGHDIQALLEVFQLAEAETSRPTAIIAHTVKGKGVSFMENNNNWHQRACTPEELELALAELERGGEVA